MDRIQGLSQTKIDTLRSDVTENYPNNEKPCPGTPLQKDDDIMYLDMFAMRVLWGTDNPDYALFYAPDVFGEDAYGYLDAHYITDRAPLDPNETPMPIYPETQYAQQPGVNEARKAKREDKQGAKKALHHLLKQLDPEHQKKVRALVKAKRPELLDDKGG